LLAQYPNKQITYTDLTASMPAPVFVGRNITHYRIQREVPAVPGTQELLIFNQISIRMDERALIEVWINKPDVTINTKLDWHYAGTLTQVSLRLEYWPAYWPSRLDLSLFLVVNARVFGCSCTCARVCEGLNALVASR
jgi:hypothetical protein